MFMWPSSRRGLTSVANNLEYQFVFCFWGDRDSNSLNNCTFLDVRAVVGTCTCCSWFIRWVAVLLPKRHVLWSVTATFHSLIRNLLTQALFETSCLMIRYRFEAVSKPLDTGLVVCNSAWVPPRVMLSNCPVTRIWSAEVLRLQAFQDCYYLLLCWTVQCYVAAGFCCYYVVLVVEKMLQTARLSSNTISCSVGVWGF